MLPLFRVVIGPTIDTNTHTTGLIFTLATDDVTCVSSEEDIPVT